MSSLSCRREHDKAVSYHCFNCYIDNTLREAAESMGGGISISYNTSKGLHLTYRDTVVGSTMQDALYIDLELVAEPSRGC